MADRYDYERSYDRGDRERDYEYERGRGGREYGNWPEHRTREGWSREGEWGPGERFGGGREEWGRERGWGAEGRYGGRPEFEREGAWRGERGGSRPEWNRPEWHGGSQTGGMWRGERPWQDTGMSYYGGSMGAYTGGMGGYGERGQFTGRGPKGYQRSDERIREDVCERLTQHPEIDASEIEVHVKNGEVTLTGSVERREMKRMAEETAEHLPGVKDVHNQLRLQPQGAAVGQGKSKAG